MPRVVDGRFLTGPVTYWITPSTLLDVRERGSGGGPRDDQAFTRPIGRRTELWMLLHDLALPFGGQPELVQHVEDHDGGGHLHNGCQLLDWVIRSPALVRQVVPSPSGSPRPSVDVRHE